MAFVIQVLCAYSYSVAALPLLRHEQRNVAYILYGGVSKAYLGGRFDASAPSTNEDYAPLRITGALMKKHIFKFTPDADIFIHSWVPQLKHDYLEVFKPADTLFENNTGMSGRFLDTLGCKNINAKAPDSCTWQTVSCIYAWQQAMNLMFSYEKAHGKRYDIVMLLRPDIVHFDDLDVAKMFRDENTIYHDTWGDCGDLHFIMSRANAVKVAAMYQNLENDSPPGFLHDRQCFKAEYFKKFMGAKTESSGFIDGETIMIYRRMSANDGCSVTKNNTRMDDLHQAGFEDNDLLKLGGLCHPDRIDIELE